MTRANSKRVLSALVSAMMLASSVLPAFARESPSKASIGQTSVRTGGEACTRISDFATDLKSRVDERGAALNQRRDERQDKIKELRDEHVKDMEDRRSKWGMEWDKLIARLQSWAKNDAQKAAILAFKTSMESAFQARKTAVDAADAAFRTALDASVAAKKTAVSAAVSAFQTSVQTALDKAKSDCAAGVSADTVRTNLKTALEAARAKLQSDLKSINLIDGKARDLAKTRQAAIEKANADFKAAAEKARATLKAALKAAMPPGSATGTKETEDGHGDDKSSNEGQE